MAVSLAIFLLRHMAILIQLFCTLGRQPQKERKRKRKTNKYLHPRRQGLSFFRKQWIVRWGQIFIIGNGWCSGSGLHSNICHFHGTRNNYRLRGGLKAKRSTVPTQPQTGNEDEEHRKHACDCVHRKADSQPVRVFCDPWEKQNQMKMKNLLRKIRCMRYFQKSSWVSCFSSKKIQSKKNWVLLFKGN